MEFAIRHFRYYDNKRDASNYTIGDLVYDVTAGRIADPREASAGGTHKPAVVAEEEGTEEPPKDTRAKSPPTKTRPDKNASTKVKSPIVKMETGSPKALHPFFAGTAAKKPSRAPPKVKIKGKLGPRGAPK